MHELAFLEPIASVGMSCSAFDQEERGLVLQDFVDSLWEAFPFLRSGWGQVAGRGKGRRQKGRTVGGT